MFKALLIRWFYLFLVLISLPTFAQLNISTNSNATALAKKIVGQGITVLNAQYTGSALASGTFTAVHGSFPMDSGIVLTTGRAKSIAGSPGADGAASSFASFSNGAGGDATLTQFANGSATNNASVLEFDFIPQGDSMSIRYIFASEEYPEYVCTQFNDVFAFVLTGPGIITYKNIALVPNAPSNTPVTINSVNSGIPGSSGGNISNCWAMGPGSPFTQYYWDNQSGVTVTYDAGTVVLTAKAAVQPCKTYHFKLGVADVTDGAFDSGVFLEANSFISKRYFDVANNPQYVDATGRATLIEGCKKSDVTLTRAAGIEGPFDVYVTYGGTATAGVDYNTLPATINFTAADNVKTFPISATVDAFAEGTEKAMIYFSKYNTCLLAQSSDSAVVYIKDSLVYRNKFDTSFCTVTPITIKGRDTVANTTNSYLWNTGNTTQAITVNQPGTYNVVHTYSTRCFNVDTFKIVSNDPTLTSANTNPQICMGDSVTLSVTSNADTLTWNTGAHGNSITVSSSGQYWIVANNNKGCSKADTFNVTLKPSPIVNLGQNRSICQNDTAQLDATHAGATYLWNTGATSSSITVNTPGTYSVISTLNGCNARDTIDIAVSPLPSINLGRDTIFCQGSNLQLNAFYTGASHIWNTGDTTSSITVNTTDTYWVVNTLNGCTAKDSIEVTVNPAPLLDLGPNRSICQNDTAQLNAAYAGANYIWNTGETTPSIIVNTNGDYSVTSTLNGCSVKDTITINVTQRPVVNLGNDTTICANTGLQLNATYPGATHQWNTGATSATINVNTAGTYSVVNNINGCTATGSINVTVQPAPVLELGGNRSICQNDTAQLHAFYPNASYVWSTGETIPSIIVSTTGNYSVTSTLNGCSSKDTVTITVKPLPQVNLGNDTSICQGSSIQLNAFYAGASYNWSTGATSSTVTVNSSGNYSVVNTLNGCTANSSITITVKPVPVVDLGAGRSICQGDSVLLDAFYPSATYLWNTGATTSSIMAKTTGDYSVVSTINGCDAKDTVNVNVKPLPSVNLGANTSICNGSSIQLNAFYPGASYSWNTGATTSTITASNAGTYSVLNTLNNCTATSSITISVQQAPVVNLGPDRSMCEHDTVHLDAFYPNATYNWSNGAATPVIIVDTTGTYSVTSSINGCSAADTANVYYKKMPVANAGLDMVIPENSTAQLNATQHSNNASYLWSPAYNLSNPSLPNPIATPSTATEYTLTVTSVDGCELEDKVWVRLKYPLSIPNAFSPNGDKINDTWKIANIEYQPKAKVFIYNRYGQEVFSAQGRYTPWDGTSKGKPLPVGTYYYIIESGDGEKFTGWVVLLR